MWADLLTDLLPAGICLTSHYSPRVPSPPPPPPPPPPPSPPPPPTHPPRRPETARAERQSWRSSPRAVTISAHLRRRGMYRPPCRRTERRGPSTSAEGERESDQRQHGLTRHRTPGQSLAWRISRRGRQDAAPGREGTQVSALGTGRSGGPTAN